MRTTISLDDRVGKLARRRAREEGLSLSASIRKLLADALTREASPDPPPPFRLVTVGGPGPMPGIDLDRSSELLVVEDEETYGRGAR